MDYDSANHREDSVGIHAEDLTISIHCTFTTVENEENDEATNDGIDIHQDYHVHETRSVHKISTVGIVFIQLEGQILLSLGKADVLIIDRPEADVPVSHENVEE